MPCSEWTASATSADFLRPLSRLSSLSDWSTTARYFSRRLVSLSVALTRKVSDLRLSVTSLETRVVVMPNLTAACAWLSFSSLTVATMSRYSATLS